MNIEEKKLEPENLQRLAELWNTTLSRCQFLFFKRSSLENVPFDFFILCHLWWTCWERWLCEKWIPLFEMHSGTVFFIHMNGSISFLMDCLSSLVGHWWNTY